MARDMVDDLFIEGLLVENERRLSKLFRTYNPMTGEGAPGRRFPCRIEGVVGGEMLYLPEEMLSENSVLQLIEAGSVTLFVRRLYNYNKPVTEAMEEEAVRSFVKIWCEYDFYFYSYAYARIKNKAGGEDISFMLRPAQLKLIAALERMRKAGKPIRLILLKCRQWGGSTAVQVYMSWIQLFHKRAWNSIIVGHQGDSAAEVKDMYIKLINGIPKFLLYGDGVKIPSTAERAIKAGGTQNISLIPSRLAKIKTASALSPESARGGDVSMAHCTEVAFWPDTEKITPEKLVKSVCSGITLQPLTMIVYESTPNGTENFFKEEWDRANAVDGYGERVSEFEPLFVAWFEIETYITAIEDKRAFANQLVTRSKQNKQWAYFWWLWTKGATLEGIAWYIQSMKRYKHHDDMKQEYPSDDIEAFKFSGNTVFDQYQIRAFERWTKEPIFVGEIYGDEPKGARSVEHVRVAEQANGRFRVWEWPEADDRRNRYIVSVDIGGKSRNSDYSCITVFDRGDMPDGGIPRVVAEWYGHTDPDLLAITCAQVAIYYKNGLLVVENNTAYSRMNNTDGDVSQLFFPILVPLYRNLYNEAGDDTRMIEQGTMRWGFYTNRSKKVAIVMNLQTCLREGGYLERDKGTLNEFYSFLQWPNGSYGAANGKHDDKLMSRGIGLYVCYLKSKAYPMTHVKRVRQSTVRSVGEAQII